MEPKIFRVEDYGTLGCIRGDSNRSPTNIKVLIRDWKLTNRCIQILKNMETNINFKITATSSNVLLLKALLTICESDTDEVFAPSDTIVKTEETETPKSENPVIDVVRKKKASKNVDNEVVKPETVPEPTPEPTPEKSEKAVDEVFIRSRIAELEAQRETPEQKSEFRKGVKTLLNEIGAGGRIPGLTPEMYSPFLTKLNEL